MSWLGFRAWGEVVVGWRYALGWMDLMRRGGRVLECLGDGVMGGGSVSGGVGSESSGCPPPRIRWVGMAFSNCQACFLLESSGAWVSNKVSVWCGV